MHSVCASRAHGSIYINMHILKRPAQLYCQRDEIYSGSKTHSVSLEVYEVKID